MKKRKFFEFSLFSLIFFSLSFSLFVNLKLSRSLISLEKSLYHSIFLKKALLNWINSQKPIYIGKNPLEIKAEAGISLYFKKGKEKILFEKNKEKKLPIASLSKLITAYLSKKIYPLEKEVTISRKAVLKDRRWGRYKEGEKFDVKNLIYSTLIESSNTASFALSQIIGEKKFVNKMNELAKEIGLKDTYFSNPTGLPTYSTSTLSNYSTAYEMAKLALFLLKNDPSLLEISALWEKQILTKEGKIHHLAKNKNLLLKKYPHIIGGKTGYTKEAGKSLLLIMRLEKGYLINVILKAENRFKEMEKLIKWILTSYLF